MNQIVQPSLLSCITDDSAPKHFPLRNTQARLNTGPKTIRRKRSAQIISSFRDETPLTTTWGLGAWRLEQKGQFGKRTRQTQTKGPGPHFLSNLCQVQPFTTVSPGFTPKLSSELLGKGTETFLYICRKTPRNGFSGGIGGYQGLHSGAPDH